MSNGTSKRNVVAAVLFSLVLASAAGAGSFTWNTAGGGDWGTAGNWTGASGYPTSPGDTATIKNDVPSTWPNGENSVNVNVTGITIDTLTIEDNVSASAVRLNVNQNMTVTTFKSKQDGAQRNRVTIASGKTLNVNAINFTGDFHIDVGGGGGKIKFFPVAGAASWGYIGFHDNDRIRNVDFSDPDLATMTITRNGGGAAMEARDNAWTVGRTTGDQEFTVSGGTLELDSRATGSPWMWYKVGNNDVDMGKRTGGNPSDGVRIARARNGDHDGGQKRNLFTDTAGNAAGGLVKIADYEWIEQSNGNAHWLQWEKIGADLTITDGGQLRLRGRNSNFDEVCMVWVMSGKTLTIEGAGGDLQMDAVSGATSTSRRGLYYADAMVDLGGSLDLQGPRTFLNDGGLPSGIFVGGNVNVQSTDPTGFATISGLASGHTAASDDFNTRMTVLTMDGGGGGGARSIDWADGVGIGGGLDASDFSLDNFTLAILLVSNGTDVNLLDGEEMFLNVNLVIEPGSTLTLADTGAIYLLDPDLSELQRISGYLGTELLNAHVETVRDVGVAVVAGEIVIPEPATMALLGVGGLGLLIRRRK